MKKIFKLMTLAMVVMLMGCSDGKSGYSIKDFMGSDSPEAAHMLSRASSRCLKIKAEGGKLTLGGGPCVDGMKYSNSDKSVEEGQWAFVYHSEVSDKYYLILAEGDENANSLRPWCEENLK